MTSPDQQLRMATAERRRCEVRAIDGEWIAARLEGVEPAGLVLDVSSEALGEGTDVRLWFDGDAGPVQYSGTIIRAQVPLPGSVGVIVGLLTEAAGSGSTLSGSAVDLLLDDGSEVALLDDPARVTSLTTTEVGFWAPVSDVLRLQQQATLKVRLAPEGEAPCEVRGPLARVSEPKNGGCACAVSVELVERADLQLRAVAALRRLLHLV